MKKSQCIKKIMSSEVLISCLMILFIGLIFMETAGAGTYLDSVHGNSIYGVKRDAAGFPADYARGHCAHCHEMHASIDGGEPDPDANSPSLYTLFYDNHIDQTDNFCFQCHDVISFQDGGGMTNHSYSYRAGGYTPDTFTNVKDSFSFPPTDSDHNLDDILTFITGRWNYTVFSNPCAACHNPHAAQGDPAASNLAKSAGTRGWPVSRPSLHNINNNTWGLWGDGAGEKMSDYSLGYQAPLRFTANYEPDGSLTQDGSNLTDYVTFCTDCHNNTNIINSTDLGRNLNTFDWAVEKHGQGVADNNIPNVNEPVTCSEILAPYQVGLCGNYVLACTDCHEPHGSPNLFLVRKEVNSAVVTVDTGTGAGPSGNANTEWINLCNQCHNIAIGDARHDHPATIPPSLPGPGCNGVICHGPLGTQYALCTNCHNHGNGDIIDFLGPNLGPYGDQLF
jgi:hypothetical protein